MSTTDYVIRSQDEIVARIRELGEPGSPDAMFGWRREVLFNALEFDHAKPFLKDGVTREEWDADRTTDVPMTAREYLDFAIGKIRNHRSISASRSVEKLEMFAWLLGRDDVVAAMDAADYPQYGAPQVKAFAEGMGWLWRGGQDLDRMANGLPCTDDCYEGCGS